jgi:Na+-driven multidrug efflux pump
MNDLTQGSESRAIVRFAVPMLIGNVFQQFYQLVDSIIVGQGVGKEALGAIGASMPIIFLMVSLIIGVTMGATIMLSQYFGARDTERMRRTMDTAFIFLFGASIVVSIAGVFLSTPILRAMRTP